MEDLKVSELPIKSDVEITDQFIIEDENGTKLGDIGSLKKLMVSTLFFDTVEDMKTHSFKEGEVCTTLGYYSRNDGGGATYKIEYAPAKVEDKANIHYLYTSDTLRAIFVSLDGDVTPEQFGAYGNGYRDDYNAIKKCIDSGYNVNFIKSHKYKINTALPLSSNLNLDFNGTTLIPSYCDGLSKTYSSTEPPVEYVNIRNVILDMENGSNGFNLQHPMKHARFSNIRIKNLKLNGFKIADIEDCHINNCTIEAAEFLTNPIGINISGNIKSGVGLNITDSDFVNLSPAVMVSIALDNHSNSITLDNCRINRDGLEKDDFANAILFINGNINASVNNLKVSNLKCIFTVSSNTVLAISNINAIECDSLIDNINSDADITIGNGVVMYSDDDTSKTIIPRLYGNLNIMNPTKYSDSYIEIYNRGSNNANYTGTIQDSNSPLSYKQKVHSGERTLYISECHNTLIELNNSIDSIVGGINGQIICLVSSNSSIVSKSSTIIMKSAIHTLSSDEVLLLKRVDDVWVNYKMV